MTKKYKDRLIIFFSVFFALVGQIAYGQISVSASIDSSSIEMGQQTVVRFKVTQPQQHALQLPVLSDQLAPNIFIVGVEGDTIVEGNNVTLQSRIKITVFQPGSYVIPPFVCKDKDRDYATSELNLEVRDYPENFEEGKIPGDIANIYEPPYSVFIWVVLIAAAVVFIGIVVWGIFYTKKHKNDPEPYVRNMAVSNSATPVQTALEMINKLGNEKLWQTEGKEKQFFTELTDVLRQYFYRRYKIQALEMTSSELLDALKQKDVIPFVRNEVRDICFTGDMTKFAKHKPSNDVCEKCVAQAIDIINRTSQSGDFAQDVNNEKKQ